MSLKLTQGIYFILHARVFCQNVWWFPLWYFVFGNLYCVVFFSELEILDIFSYDCFQSPRFLKQNNQKERWWNIYQKTNGDHERFFCILTSSVNIMNTVFNIFFQKGTGSLVFRYEAASQQERWNSTCNGPQLLTWIGRTYFFTLVIFLGPLACMLYCLWTMKSSDSSLVRHLPTHWEKGC